MAAFHPPSFASFLKRPIQFQSGFPSSLSPPHRFESLDDLDSLRQPSPSSCAALTTHPRPHSAAAWYCAPSRNSSSRYSTGAILARRPATMDCSHPGRFVSRTVALVSFFFLQFWPHTAHLCVGSLPSTFYPLTTPYTSLLHFLI